MRTIHISTDVFAALRAKRRPGEDTEDAILSRVLGAPSRGAGASLEPAGPENPPANGTVDSRRVGFAVPKYRVEVPEGFEIFRTFRGERYRATAIGGLWRLENNGTTHQALTRLSSEIRARVENVWANWLYKRDDGSSGPLSELRDQTRITTRNKYWTPA